MIPDDTLIELFGVIVTEREYRPRKSFTRPSGRSIKKIQTELGVTIPDAYIRLAYACRSYAGWLASIGEDYDDDFNILRLNQSFHDPQCFPTLPKHFVILNHGHDGDCDCWDTRSLGVGSEHPIVYVDAEAKFPKASGARFESFSHYIEDFVRSGASRIISTSERQRALNLLKNYGG